MSWLPVLILALGAFGAAVVLLRLPRSSWTLLGAALLFGLSGYAMQGSPGTPASPRAPGTKLVNDGELLVAARREFYGVAKMPSRFVVTSDAFTRRGQYENAARFLHNAVSENPRDGEAWLALGNVLVEHAEGQLTPAALHAYSRAEQVEPTNPAPTYFLGLAMLRAGRPMETRALWAGLLAKGPADADWRPALTERLARLDALIAMVNQQQRVQKPEMQQ